ncbi:signal recognition particle-docking protein FtsY [Actinomycetospora rhizophila]|uniref:Signal recognition particle receptor FtsY n=1 Tax=Actinomycetospora rhizophila TaxID=1416876 RepID=A0ABV9ZHX9_9PSEU
MVVAVIVVLLIVLGVGLYLRRRRQVSLAEEEQEETKPTKGSYQAGGGFSFSAGSGPSTLTPPRPEPRPEPQPEPKPEPEPRPEPSEPAARPETGGPQGTAPPGAAEAPPAAAPAAPAEPEPEPEPEPDTAATGPGTLAVPDVEAGPQATAPPEAAEPETAPRETPAPEAPETPETPETPAATATTTETTTEPSPETTTETVAPSTGTTVAPAAPPEEIPSAEGRLERLRGRLGRSRSTLGQGLLGLLGAGDLDEDSWEEVEDTLLLADLGSATTQEIVSKLRERIASRGVRTADQARELLREVLVESLGPDMERSVRALAHDGRPAVVLVAGVNGTGKTTTTGKLARVLVADGFVVLLGAADTFRAAAAEQLATWGERAGAETVRGKEGADPASVAFDAVRRGTESGVDAVLLDTAGRLHTKTGLMDELGKVKRVVERQAEVDEVLLVLDATTGQNGLTQARVFSEVVDVTGVVLTKLDGTAKGGIVFQVQRELGVPVKLVGLGEGPDDLAPFEPGAFVDALLK